VDGITTSGDRELQNSENRSTTRAWTSSVTSALVAIRGLVWRLPHDRARHLVTAPEV
jgi:hypothetical protein